MTYAISVEDIHSAAERLEDVAVRTPLIENVQLNEITGGRVFVKAECLQHTGSFKFRGAYNRLSRLSAEEKERGVLAFSSGNHAQGVARAAQLLGIKATIIMPEDAPALKLAATKGYGADVVTYDRYTEDREEVAATTAGDSGVVIVPPYNDPFIMAGQGTAGLETVQDLRKIGLTPDQALVNCGGGGLASGFYTAMYDAFPNLNGYVVEPEEFDDVKRSLETGDIQTIDFNARSICDALLTPSPGKLTFPIIKDKGVTGITVSDDEARAAVSFAARHMKLTGEPGGIVSLAAILAGKVETAGKITVCIISGGNVDPQMHTDCILNF
ncbi:threonine ammonia-lyase [Kordiimonas aquimaris]|uniref:threonine ammonia-lyase n=1 Tax=Kordiimonas aquimaris TaxID=707591 RepID=UPI0021D197D0|nr:threonine/serine dehydratase [Kordiimonas aquimaris]